MTTAAAMVMVFTLLRGTTGVTSSGPAPVSTTWETAALVPPTESRAEPNSEIALLTLWMTEGLTDRGGR